VKSTELEYVGFWARAGASLIDVILQLVIVIPLTFVIYGRLRFMSPVGSFLMGPVDVFVNYILPAVVVIAMWVRFGATPGKMALSAKVGGCGHRRAAHHTCQLAPICGLLSVGDPVRLGVFVGRTGS